uniref:Beta/gamma crystallin 'Greek key' domain-containing protein n=1 Tax=Knipowitschia caucasica TaxID=637954 RepID=A0AAV2K9J7_KNICA
MVFSPTADSPEEQPNGSGVLSRIGSWIWARSPIGSSDNPSPTSGRAGQPDSLADDVFYPFPQDSKKSSQTTESKPSGEETPEEEWEEARSSFDCSNQDTKNSFCSTEDSGKKLHVYLEEISESAGHEIVSTKYAKSLKVRPKAKSSVSLDTENRHRYSSELVGVNLKPQAFEHLEDLEMGRKGARRRHRKDSQGDDKSNSTKPCQELTDKDVSSSQRAKSPKSKHASNTAPSPSPEVKSRSSGCVESSQGLQSTLACSGAALKEANMEDNDRLYRVERKTETPESKRRSMKVSRSEVKLFPKNVPLPSARPEKSDFKMTVGREGIKEETSADLKLKEAKNTEEKAKPAMGRITDRINIFEKRKLETGRQLDAPLNAEQRVMTIQERVRNFNQACNTSSQTQNLSRTHRKVSASKSLELLDVPDGPDASEKDMLKAALQFNGGNAKTSRSKDDWSQDVPSSYLDVDFPKQKFKVLSEGKLTSSGSESNLLDTSGDLDDEDFVEKIKKLCAPFSLPPRRHHPLRSPQPPFAMPAIKEDRFEKTFDPEMFTFGLRKKSKFSLETPSLLAKLQNPDGKPCIKAARASLAERSMLLSGLESRFRDKDASKDEQEEAKDDAKDEIKVKSRLEGSCVLNSLTTSSFRSKPGQSQAQTQSTISENVSPGPPPCPAQTNPEERDKKEEIQCAEELVACDSAPPIPTSNQVKLSDFLLKHHPEEAELEQEQPSGEQEVAVKMPSLDQPSATTAQTPPKSLTNHFSGISLKDQAPPPAAPPRRRPANKIQAAKGFHKRPGKMLLFEKAPFEGQVYEVHRDVEDATSMLLSALVSVRVVRGCWVLYENPGFQGRTIALEEGALELTNIWAQPAPDLGLEPGLEPLEPCDTPLQIGSIRLAVSDYSIPHIDLFTEPEGRGRVTSYHDDVMETGSFGIPLSTASVQVHSGVWLVFSDPGFQGMLAVLEMGGYPLPEAWGFPSPFVGSLRPLKMGGLKVENPNEVKALVYECSGFEGPALETEADMFCFGEEGGGQDTSLQSVGSLKILGGLWVGFSEPGFEGQQYILEEGEYESCEAWGGGHILSLRPIMADFMSPHVKLFSDRDFGALGVNIDLTIPVINLDDTGYGLKTQSINVVSGVWVVFEEAGFSGESFLLERGQYGTPEDWGSARPVIASAMPVVLENFENTAKFKIQLFPEADFQGPVVELDDSEAHLPPGCSVASCKVLAGSWLAYEGPDYSGSMYVLEEGSYSDLRAMGCVHSSATILSLQIAGFEFSLPSIVLFERAELKGKRLVLCEGEVNLLMSGGGGRVQSVLVEGGMWVLYEEINYRGAQILLRPGEVCDWRHFSGWRRMGSLRPLLQKQVHFHICSRLSGQLLTVTGDLDDIKLLRVQETEASGGFEQIWFFQHGHLRCKLLEECCLCPSSSVTIAGARVGLTPALDNTTHMWSITPEGFISYSANPDLVLDIKGGHNYDKSQVVLNTRDPKRAQQQWLIQVL